MEEAPFVLAPRARIAGNVLAEGIDRVANRLEPVELDERLEVVLDYRTKLEPPRLDRRQGNQATASTSNRRSGWASPATCTSVLVGGRVRSTNSSRTARIVKSPDISTTK